MSKVYFMKCKVELGKHAFKLLIRAIYFSSPLFYKKRWTPHSTHLLCRVRVKEERQHSCPKAAKDSATVLVYFSKEKDSKTLLHCWYISAKKRTARLCYTAGIYQYKKAAYQDNKYLL
jgi:hypothetical protein